MDFYTNYFVEVELKWNENLFHPLYIIVNNMIFVHYVHSAHHWMHLILFKHENLQSTNYILIFHEIVWSNMH